MKLSIKVHYGLKAVVELALHYESGGMQIADVAKSQGIPVRFLEQILLILKKRGILASSRGVNGGYSLLKHPSEISLLDIVEALDGQIELTNDKAKKVTILAETLIAIQDNFISSLKNVTIEDLVIKKRQRDRAFTYNI